jgi:SpoVK/Ycf46/Vps4 family AAA+-type ATPase
MNNNNSKSPNKSHIHTKNNNINKDIIDISNNFHNLFDNSKNIFNFKTNQLHPPVEKTIEQLIDELCDEFDGILKFASTKSLNIDQSYNRLMLKDKDNKTNNSNISMNNKKVYQKKHFSDYLNTNNRSNKFHYKKAKNISRAILDIDQSYDNLFFKKHVYKNTNSPSDLLTDIPAEILNTPIPKQIYIEKKKVNIDVTLNNIGDLIQLTEKYPLSPEVEYNIDMEVIHLIKPDLVRLNEMIGMHALKENILDQIIYFIQKLHVRDNQNVNNEFMHTVIYGPPGTGKTETAHIIGAIYSKLGILKNNVFKKVTRADLIAGYLGQTALKTKEMIKSAIGGVLFIDEAYALGNKEQKDSFAKECIDTLCEALSNHKHELMVIIAGYEEDLNKCFFSYNQGLDSRFIWRFKIDDYNSKELQLIFNKKVKDCGWEIKKISSSWFEKNLAYFKYFGRDMETLLSKVKISHSRRVFCLPEADKRKITIKDMENGFKLYLKNGEVKSRGENSRHFMENMYI